MSKPNQKKSGFTEAELAAAAWSRAQREAREGKQPMRAVEVNKSRHNRDSREGRKRIPSRSRSRSRSKERSHRQRSRSPRRRSPDRTDRRGKNDRYKPEPSKLYPNFVPSSQNRNNSDDPSPKNSYYGPPPTQPNQDTNVILDEFGRVRGPDYRPPKRSHSRSRSPSVDRAWRHDKFHRVLQSPSPERQIPADYRPPSPEWISRAGGVAIMKKRKEDKNDNI